MKNSEHGVSLRYLKQLKSIFAHSRIVDMHQPNQRNMDVTVTKGTIVVNGQRFDIFSGFMTASEIISIARVPAFTEIKSNYDIARDLLTTPVDEWQRPQDSKKVEKIAELYSKTTQSNVMPNGVLLGIDVESCDPEEYEEPAKCSTTPYTIDRGENNEEDREVIPNVHRLKLQSSGELKPLLILDGQHRIAGLNRSSQRDQPVPFVLCKNGFEQSKLAEIFTHVTTEATQMKDLHKNWMQYAFALGPFVSNARQKAGETTIRLCTEDGTFKKKIRFNDYTTIDADTTRGGFNQKPLNFKGWSTIIADYYFTRVAEAQWPDSRRLASAITNAIDAIGEITVHKSESKFFSLNHHSILCEEFLKQLLVYISGDVTRLTYGKNDWKTFFKEGQRQWHNADFRLPYVLSIGQNADDLSISRKIAKNCFEAFFLQPTDLMGMRMHQYLKGEGGFLLCRAYKKKADGTRDYRNDPWEKIVSASRTITINDDGVDRDFFHIDPVEISSNWIAKKARDPDLNSEPVIGGVMVKRNRAINLKETYPGETSKAIRVPIHSYHSSSKQTIDITINW
jgi:hypothetical protein